MLCKKPFIQGSALFPCGQCLPCRLNRRRLWTHRLILESLKHENSIFVTLTYNPESLPEAGTLVPLHLQLFLKRLRTAISPQKIRFYAVGEYGELSGRPHYHLALFGIGPEFTDVISRCWPFGSIDVGSLTLESAQYIAGYVVKKMTSTDDPRLEGRHPEFSRMSLKPGIGAIAMPELIDFLSSDMGRTLIDQSGDVPTALRHGGKMLPLGRYLRRKLREALKIPEKGSSNPLFQAQIQEMSNLFEASEARTKWQKLNVYHKANRPKVRSLETRHKIYSRKDKL